jgi:protein-tyrosine kinase
MAGPQTTWVDTMADKIFELGSGVAHESSARKPALIPGAAKEHAASRTRPETVLLPSDEALQTAARLKILLADGRMAVFAGLTPQDGATPLLIQVGSALASIDPSPVLLIDANSRAPMLHRLLELPRQPGLAECLENDAMLDSAVRGTAVNNLFVLPLGEDASNLSLRLSAAEAERFFARIREQYRYILVDAGVILQTSESVMLSSMSDGVVIALAAGKRRQHEIVQCREGLDRLKLRLLGIVLTKNSPRA